MIGKTVVCWLNGNSHDTEPRHIAEALEEKLRIGHHEIKVVKHFPEQYLIFFDDSRAYQRVLHHREVPHRGRMYNFEPWNERREIVASKLERVRLRIEGVPPHAWSEEVVAKLIPNCAIHYVEGYTRRQDRTRTYDLWAWCSNPRKIPKKVLFSISDPDREQAADAIELYYNPPQGFKRAYDYKIHIHLDVVEDLTFGGGHGDSGDNRKARWGSTRTTECQTRWGNDAVVRTMTTTMAGTTIPAETTTTTATTTSTTASGATGASPPGAE
jgi:hypothetical protein